MILKKLSSDDLRDLLGKNVQTMNQLTEQNTDIVNLLKQRGLQPVEAASQPDGTVEAAKATRPEVKDEPLTAEELRAEGWWCATAGWPEMLILMDAEMVVDNHARSLIAGPLGLASGASSEAVVHCELSRINTGYLKQVCRTGEHFYWVKP